MGAPNTTPGPWSAETAVNEAGFETGKVWIIMLGAPCAYDFDRIEDARQAAASPDLYDALEELHRECVAAAERAGTKWPLTGPARALDEKCRLALSKARGELAHPTPGDSPCNPG